MNFLKLPLYTICVNTFLIVAWTTTPPENAGQTPSLFGGILFVAVVLNIATIIADNLRLEGVK